MSRVAIITLCITLLTIVSGVAQQVIVVDSEKIFRSIDQYNQAITRIESESQEGKRLVEERFEEVESLFEEYAQIRSTLTAMKAQQVEAYILQKESEATKLQESLFAQNGVVAKMRVELIKPIQERVFKAIESYANGLGAEVVLDRASNVSLLFCSDKVDHTQRIIEMLKNIKN